MQILEPSPRSSAGFVPRVPGAASAGAEIDVNDSRWQLAMRIATSGSLGRSQLLSDFLLHIVDRSIRGRTDQITEQQIGVLVFGRTEDYNSNDDNIVRSYARKLRKRIDEYFATEGRDEPLRLEIPRGGYTPIFFELERAPSEADASIDDSHAAASEVEADTQRLTYKPIERAPINAESLANVAVAPQERIAGRFTSGMLFALLVGLMLGAGVMLLFFRRPPLSPEDAVSHSLWRQLFNKDRDTFIVPSDAGLVIMQRLLVRPVPLASYVSGTYRTQLRAEELANAREILKLSNRRYTSVVDLDLAARLAELREAVPARMMIRYARDLRMDDLRSGNAILIGSDESNPWIELFRPQLHFSFRLDADPDKPSGFANIYPRPGEATLYTTKGQEEKTYGVIAYLPNLSNSGHVLIVAGLNTAGTQAAAAFLLDPASMMPILKRARTAHGDLQPFELMVGASNVATNASTPHMILERIGLPPKR